ncbi:uncharacterized protein IL334_007205 [Kwoniella shivajii]|uniref:RanBP2-type domain-containing protein n=1 Tax=Kwoniella shivajii TaxID=564305 RepID=A0ABZ1D809_9TREE|nr:hypothetical protein IL334_007205 [Kwoniella shivajii]
MERSSSQRDLRAERLSRTPYSRPEPTRLRKSASMTPLATLKSIVNYVSSPFTRSSNVLPTHNNDLDVRITDVDQKSESGSEDEWNGDAPEPMQGQDVFSLASAAGRQGEEFDERAADWRAKGEKPGGRRQLTRLGLEAKSTVNDLGPPTPTAPGHFNFLKSSPSMPVLSSTNSSSSPQTKPSSTIKRAISPLVPTSSEIKHSTLPSRTPIPSFERNSPATPAAGVNGLSSSASSVALTAFLEAKKGQQMTSEDIRVNETLTENMKAESHIGSPTISGTSQKYGGWAAGSYSSGIKSSQTFDSLTFTPAKQTNGNNPNTPGTVFSIGTGPILTQQPSPYRQRYLGPGMSPRRMFPQHNKSSLKPLFNFGSTEEDGITKGKKRKVGEEEEMDIDQTSSSTHSSGLSKGLSSSSSMPSLSSLASPIIADKGKNKLSAPSHTPARPSPLSRNIASPGSVTSTPGGEQARRKAEAEALGKKRAAEIIMDIIDEEIGPVIPTRKAEPVIFNPYDRTSLNPSPAPAVPTSQASTAYAGSTPRKSSLKSSTSSPARRTPTRGAAAKLELHKEAMKGSKPLTTIERIKGVRPWEKGESPSKSSSQIETPPPDEDIIEIDELFDESQPPSEINSPAPPSPQPIVRSASSNIPTAETFKPFNPPSITFNTQPLPKSQPVPTIGSFDSPTRDSIISSSQTSSDNLISKPTFTFSKPASAESKEIDDVPRTGEEKKTEPRLDTSKIYLSAKDSALKIDKPALPFFTFTLPSGSLSSAKKEVLEEAKRRIYTAFTFTLTPRSTITPASTGIAPSTEWTCDLCMLKNPATATEKCEICETPKPDKSASAATATPSISFGLTSNPNTASASGDWTCPLCMLQNPASATEKCTVCATLKPGPITSTSGSGFGGFSGFGQGQNPAEAQKKSGEDGEWTCSLCMLNDPGSAKEKCTVCKTSR